MVHYKLTYFAARGLAEVSRQLLHLGNVEFQDERLDLEQFTARKSQFPFKQVPVLNVDGIEIPQSLSIARYLARKFGYAGKTPEEEAMVDAFGDLFSDFRNEIRDYFYTAIGHASSDLEEQKMTKLIPARDKFLSFLTNFLKKSKSGFLVDSGITYADLIIIDFMTSLIGLNPEFIDNYPVIQTWREKVLNYPKLKSYLEERPKTNV